MADASLSWCQSCRDEAWFASLAPTMRFGLAVAAKSDEGEHVDDDFVGDGRNAGRSRPAPTPEFLTGGWEKRLGGHRPPRCQTRSFGLKYILMGTWRTRNTF